MTERSGGWGESSIVASLCVCCILYIRRDAVAADLSFSYADISERQISGRKKFDQPMLDC